MVTLHTLPKIIKRGKKRLGRGLGSGVGAKSTRGGNRHQSARTKIPMHFEGGQNRLVKKMPLQRGKGKNKSIQEKPLVVKLDELKVFKDGSEITKQTLFKQGIIKERDMKKPIKILSDGEISISLKVLVPTSKKAKEKIKKAKGIVDL